MNGSSASFEIRNEIQPLTAFRFAAALLVFLFHIQIRAPLFGDGPVGRFVAEGAVGMTMFFALSGFILSHAYDAVTLNLRQYFWNRIARIYPVYFLAALLALPWLAMNVGAESMASSPVHALLMLIVLVVFGLLLVQAWLPQTFPLWNNSASWSISAEAFFYSVFPLLSTALRNVSVFRLSLLFLSLCVLSSLVPVSAMVFSNAPKSTALFYASPIFRLPEFVAGMVAYRLMRQVEWTDQLRNLLIVTSVLGPLHVVALGPYLDAYTLHNWIFIPSVASMLVLLFKCDGACGRFLGNRMFVWLGQISYCFYSFQFHVLEGLKYVFPPAQVGAVAYAAAACAILLVVSACVHHFVEEPARVRIRNWAVARKVSSGRVFT